MSFSQRPSVTIPSLVRQPLPCIFEALNWPSYLELSTYSYLVPSVHLSTPYPSISPSTQSPSNRLEFSKNNHRALPPVQTKTPVPLIFPSLKSPLYTDEFGYIQLQTKSSIHLCPNQYDFQVFYCVNCNSFALNKIRSLQW